MRAQRTSSIFRLVERSHNNMYVDHSILIAREDLNATMDCGVSTMCWWRRISIRQK